MKHPPAKLVYTDMYPCGFFRTGLTAGLLFALPAVSPAQHPTLQTPPPSASTPTATQDAAQQPAGTGPTLSVEARLVNLPVVVRDKNGALVQNLTKADFVLEVDGKPQTIRYFDQDANLPLTLGLLVDTSLSQRKVLDEERSASSVFLDQMLTGTKDQAFVIQFARKIELLQDLTGSRPKLQAALKDLDSAAPGSSGSSDTSDPDDAGGGRRSRSNGGTALYDSVFLASDELMAKQKGRKAVILLTDGDDRGSKETISQAIETAQRADTIIYAIYFKGEQQRPDDDNRRGSGFPGGVGGYPGGGGYPRYPGGGGGYPGGGRGGNNPGRQQEDRTDGRKVLERMAHETGGRMFEVSRKQSTADIYMEIGKELRAQYRLGYTPDQAAAGDGYHQIDLSLAGPDKKKLTIQTRDGYYTGK